MRKNSGINIIGSLNPKKEVQDRVRVLSTGGGYVNHFEPQIIKTHLKLWFA